MKRALAERAKQSLPQTLRPPQQPSASSVDQTSNAESPVASTVTSSSAPPQKIPRLEKGLKNRASEPIINEEIKRAVPPPSPRNHRKTVSSADHHTPRRPSVDHPHHRKSREAKALADVDNSENNEEEDASSAFYLKHQNRALATELKSLQHAVQSLTEERDARRQQCYKSIQALHSLQATWTALETALQLHNSTPAGNNSRGPSSENLGAPRIPPSTGTESSVEWTLALQRALESLGRPSSSKETIPEATGPIGKLKRKRKLQQREEDDDDDSSNSEPIDLSNSGVCDMEIATNIAARANVLQEWLWKVLTSSSPLKDPEDNATLVRAELEKEKALLVAEKQSLESQVAELAAARKETAARERRVRRNVYRLSAGMLTADQVIKTVDKDDKIAAEVEIEKQQKVKIEQLHQQNEQLSNMVSEQGQKGEMGIVKKEDDGPSTTISEVQADSLKRQIADLEDKVTTTESALVDLTIKVREKEKRISELSLKQLSEEDARKLQQLESTVTELKQAQSKLKELQEKLEETRSNWAQSLGNEKAALASIDELIGKFNKRWSELTGITNAGTGKDGLSLTEPVEGGHGPESKIIKQSIQIIEMQHKLDQALENVRQSESTRASLKEALIMNGSLQAKLEEMKSKYAAVQASRNSGSGVSNRQSHSSSNNAESSGTKEKINDSSSSTPREKDSGTSNAISEKEGSSSRSDKLHRDYRRARKDLAAMTASKEAAKAKLERAEKERENLVESNARLLKQISEKDEVNAKSLSTILYLKSQTDVLTAEKNNLEQQAKTAGQMALAARLATNAKERVADEMAKEKKILEEQVERLEKQQAETNTELERISLELSGMKGKMSTENSELANALKRIEELTTENEEQRERNLDLETAFAKAKREAREAKSKLLTLKKSTEHNNSAANVNDNNSSSIAVKGSFTVEQLNTQISVLKSRLACPVCHERDKECIIMRCRHMHCQQCVDDQISSRSRKCPTCNNKFSEKDVEDIWLNT